MFRSPPPAAPQATHPHAHALPSPRGPAPPSSARPRPPAKDGAAGGEGGRKPPAGKDVSHVPCRFFRSGQCSAGQACGFAHVAHEPGAQKQVCGYFLKGSCKFGHKCALAHVHPGEPMSQDRKNKKAAQLEAQAAARAAAALNGHADGPNGGGGGGRGGRASGAGAGHEQRSPRGPGGQQQQPQRDLSLLTLASISAQQQQRRQPQPPHGAPLPASLSNGGNGQLPPLHHPPGAIGSGSPRGMLSGLDLLNATRAQQQSLNASAPPVLGSHSPLPGPQATAASSPARLPPAPHLSSPPHGPALSSVAPHRPGFPASSSSSSSLPSGFLPSPASRLIPPASGTTGTTSAGAAGSPFSTSPFAGPGPRALFLSASYDAHARGRAGRLPASLPASALRTPAARDARARSFLDRWLAGAGSSEDDDDDDDDDGDGDDRRRGMDEAVVDDDDADASDDGEEFLPSSLSELLTEHEMERRITRRNSNQPGGAGAQHQQHRQHLLLHQHQQHPSLQQMQQQQQQQQQQQARHVSMSTSAAAAFPISRLHSDSALYSASAAQRPAAPAQLPSSTSPWIESVPPPPPPPSAPGGLSVGEGDRTISRRHSERPALAGADAFTAFGDGPHAGAPAGAGGSLGRSPPRAMFDSAHTLRPDAFADGGGHGAPASFDPAPRSGLASLWERSAGSGLPPPPSSSSSAAAAEMNLTTTQTRHGFYLSSSPRIPPPPSSHLSNPSSSAAVRRPVPSAAVSRFSQHQHQHQHQPPLVSPSARALASHAPGMSLPGGLGVTLSRLHYQPASAAAAAVGAEEASSSYTSSYGLPDLAGLAFGTVLRPPPRGEGAAAQDPWRTLDDASAPPHSAPGGERTIHAPTPVRSRAGAAGTTVATRAEEEDEFADDVLFE